MNKYLDCAMNNDVDGMIKAKAEGCDVHALDLDRFKSRPTPCDIHALNTYRCNAYVISALFNNPACMQQAKMDGVNVDAVDNWDHNAYMIGSHCGYADVMRQAKNCGKIPYKTVNTSNTEHS